MLVTGPLYSLFFSHFLSYRILHPSCYLSSTFIFFSFSLYVGISRRGKKRTNYGFESRTPLSIKYLLPLSKKKVTKGIKQIIPLGLNKTRSDMYQFHFLPYEFWLNNRKNSWTWKIKVVFTYTKRYGKHLLEAYSVCPKNCIY